MPLDRQPRGRPGLEARLGTFDFGFIPPCLGQLRPRFSVEGRHLSEPGCEIGQERQTQIAAVMVDEEPSHWAVAYAAVSGCVD